MYISIIATLYHSSKYINEFHQRITETVKKITEDYEIILVNDGSPDNSLEIALKLFENDKKVKIINLSRNFGHHKAIMTGLKYSKGEYIFLIDIDLEESPELLGDFYNEIKKDENIDVVFGVQEKRKGKFFERVSGSLFYKVFNMLSDIKIKPNQLTVRIFKKKYIKSLLKCEEKTLFVSALFEYIGFNQKPFIVKKLDKGSTTYTLRKKIKLLINAITSFSSKPLELFFYLGFFISGLSFTYGLYLIFMKLFFSKPLEGWTSLMVSVWFLSGTILLSLGVMGIYLSKIFDEVKNRPRSVVKNIYKHKNSSETLQKE